MFIKEKLSQSRRDFTAIYECEFCGKLVEKGGYDDNYFHENVIPQMECSRCGVKSVKPFNRIGTKYADHVVV